ncbi:hypothetical protein OBBRIDRAFT_651934 [Obba rivulosa]|uniref:Uncharacterized protein n=1 Tax=Obba rivulosa TaxID=1052685 RepID=A0A8E2DK70_9APHY|nr:hypothetical protein OBBRIDRAFT_651934 [Obba rivulosa]
MAAITITYELHPPQDTPIENLTAQKTHTSLISNTSANQKAYYEGVRQAIAQAKSTLGEELTVWRDAVGNREQTKEVKAPKKDEEEDEEEEEQEG